VWSNPFPHPRWGQGAFRLALESLYSAITHDPLPLNITQFGKPSAATFTYAENVLMNYLDEWHGLNQFSVNGCRNHPRRVYMFGDSPASGTLPV
jgi:ribonucleotide monophosphatase NagD (HAD superfamily)